MHLPENVRPLIGLLGSEDWRWLGQRKGLIGGGSVLASRWHGHRTSTDIDVMVPFRIYDRDFPRLEAILEGDGREVRRGRDDDDRIVMLAIAHPNRGEIQIVRDSLEAREKRRTPREQVAGCNLLAETTTEILTKKLRGRGLRLLQRDVYDLVAAATHDPEALEEAMRRADPRSLGTVLYMLDENEHYLVAGGDKPVLEPAVPGWREIAARTLSEAAGRARTGDRKVRGHRSRGE